MQTKAFQALEISDEDIQERFSARFRYPKQLEDLGLDCVILAPSMLEPLPERMPAEDGSFFPSPASTTATAAATPRHWLFPTYGPCAA